MNSYFNCLGVVLCLDALVRLADEPELLRVFDEFSVGGIEETPSTLSDSR